jgi:hypothetical protein
MQARNRVSVWITNSHVLTTISLEFDCFHHRVFHSRKYTHIHFHRRGIPEGNKCNLWALGIASLLSWGAGDAADWTHDKFAGEQPAVQTSVEASQVVTTADQVPK